MSGDTDVINRSRQLATIGGFLAIVLWSTTVAMARSLSEQLGPLTAAAGVYTVSALAALFSLSRDKETRRNIRILPRNYLLGCGALFVAYMIMLYLALGLAVDRQQVLEVGLLNYLWPVLTLLLSIVLLGKKANWRLVPATLLALIGIVLIVTQGGISWTSAWQSLAGNPVPPLLGLAAALAWAFYSTLTRRWAGDHAQGAVQLFLMTTALVLVPLCCGVDEPRAWNTRALLETGFLGGATYVAYGLWDTAMRKGNIILVAAGSYFTPLLSTIISCIYLTVFPQPQLWLGCVLLVAGSVLSWISVARETVPA